MDKWLLGLPTDLIVIGLSAAHDTTIYRDVEKGNPELLAICHDSQLLKQARHLLACNFDRAMAMQSWNGGSDA